MRATETQGDEVAATAQPLPKFLKSYQSMVSASPNGTIARWERNPYGKMKDGRPQGPAQF
ncbi:hypothetical protein [Limnothrix redekei]|uniref:Uncharacterized protein n=1 Tax=Limnothrix redekei LRLZ20PSL1 TaxID=3112953 RepID=A0ABW7C4T7_9CYAN